MLFESYLWLLILVGITSYFIGSLNFSILSTKRLYKTYDIRSMGSGNAGFTNVLRSAGRMPAVITFIGDFSKGVLAVWIGELLAQSQNLIVNDAESVKYFAYFAGFMCIIGHIYPCFFGFKGGKGILTSWAVTLLLDLRIFFIIISVFLIVLAISKVVSLSSISAAISYPITTFFTTYIDYKMSNADIFYVIICTFISFITALIGIYKHKSNILRIISGEEKRISIKK